MVSDANARMQEASLCACEAWEETERPRLYVERAYGAGVGSVEV